MTAAPRVSPERVATQMAVALARLLRNGESTFFGVASPLPMIAALLAKRLHAPDLVILTLPGGVNPSPGNLPVSTVDPRMLGGAAAMITLADIFDLSARGRLDTAFLGGVQVDRAGRINMSAIGDPRHPKVRLPGGAGSAALMPTALRTLIWRTRHDTRTFVSALPFVTAAGNVDRVVTPLCVLRRVGGLLTVESIHPYSSADEVRTATGFPLAVDGDTPITPLPTAEELAVLRTVDPGGVVSVELLSR